MGPLGFAFCCIFVLGAMTWVTMDPIGDVALSMFGSPGPGRVTKVWKGRKFYHIVYTATLDHVEYPELMKDVSYEAYDQLRGKLPTATNSGSATHSAPTATTTTAPRGVEITVLHFTWGQWHYFGVPQYANVGGGAIVVRFLPVSVAAIWSSSVAVAIAGVDCVGKSQKSRGEGNRHGFVS
jgi:hypothetical protein